MSPRCEGWEVQGRGLGLSKLRHRTSKSSRILFFWPPPSPAHGECLECDVLISPGLPLHLEHWVGGSATFTYPRGFAWGLRKRSMDVS